MKIVIAPQSFKGSLSAKDAAESIAIACKEIFPVAKLKVLPIADGGDGTLDTLVDATNGSLMKSLVLNPLGSNIYAEWGMLGSNNNENVAIIEMARASGLALLDPGNLDPVNSTSYGTGQLILDAINNGANKIILGIGGSATNDCGLGMAKSLGFNFVDSQGKSISNNVSDFRYLDKILSNNVDKRIFDIKFEVACDVNNTLCGPHGASYIYGPQKGATVDQIKVMDASLNHVSSIIKSQLHKDVLNLSGAGAAGGLGAAMVAFCNATLRPGVDIIFEALRVEHYIHDADLIITGEGQFDLSSTFNKAPSAIANLAKQYNIPTLGLAGSLGDGFEKLDDFGIVSKSSIINKISDLETVMNSAANLLTMAAKEQLKAIKIGMNI